MGLRIFVLILLPVIIFGQHNRTHFQGEILSELDQQPIPYAHISLSYADQQYTASTDSLGTFEIDNIPFGLYRITLTSIGYETQVYPEFPIEYRSNPHWTFELKPTAFALNEIVVRSDLPRSTEKLSDVYVMTQEQVRRYPATFYDPARLATAYPGVLNDNDQANNLSIRGNSPNQMNYFIHGAEIVNPNHLANAGTATDRPTANGGGVSLISAQLLTESRIYTGVQPLSLGQSTAGSLDYYFKSGSEDRMHFTGQAGLNGIDLSIEGPIHPKWSYVANYRYATVGLLSKMGVDFGGEEINYQDLSLQIDYQNDDLSSWKIFAIGGNNSNIFTAKEDSLREEIKDFQNIDYQSKIGIIGSTYYRKLSNQTTWQSTLALSGRTDDRTSNFEGNPFISDFDFLNTAKYTLTSNLLHQLSDNWQWKIGLNTTYWSGQLNYKLWMNNEVNQRISGWMIRPYSAIQYEKNAWTAHIGLGLQYDETSSATYLEPQFEVQRWITSDQKITLASGLHSKQQVYPILLSIPQNQSLDRLTSWKSTIAYDKLFQKSQFKAALYYESLSHVATDNAYFSSLNLLEQYPNQYLTSDGQGRNYGLELSYQRFLTKGLFYRISSAFFDAKYKNEGMTEWLNVRYNTQYLISSTIGKEFDWSSDEKNKVFGINLQLVWAGGYWTTPIDESASRQQQTTVYITEKAYTIQQPNIFKSYFRLYYKVNHHKRYSMIGLDLSNVFNRENVAYQYFDPYLDKIVSKHQLGLVPMLSYLISL